MTPSTDTIRQQAAPSTLHDPDRARIHHDIRSVADGATGRETAIQRLLNQPWWFQTGKSEPWRIAPDVSILGRGAN
jgi:hypothetical protein